MNEDLVKGCAADVGLRIKQSVSVDPPSTGVERYNASVVLGDADSAINHAVQDIPGVNAPIVTIFGGDAIVSAGNATDTVQLLSRTGADEHLDVISSVAQPGAWMSSSTATALGVTSGDRVDVVLAKATIPITVHGVFTDLVTRRDASWCSLEQQIVGPLLGANPPMLILDQTTLTRALQADGVVTTAWWEIVPNVSQWTLPVAQRAEPLLQQVARDASNTSTVLGSALAQPTASDDPQASVDHAEDATVTGSATIGATVLGSIGIALLVLADAARTWTERRRQELRILRMRGAGAVLIGCKGLLELGPAIVLGAVAGFASSYWLVRSYGPSSTIPHDAVHDAFVAAGLGLAVALVAVAFVVGLSRQGVSTGVRHVSGLALGGWIALLLSGAALYELRSRGSSIVRSSAGAHVDILVLLFPMLLTVGISAIVSPLALHPRLIRRVSRRMPIGCWLAARRLATHRRRAGLVATGTAIAIGSVAFAASASATLRATITAKATLGVGAAQVVPFNGIDTLAAGSVLEARSTRVLRTSEPTVVVAGHHPADVIAVDPATFQRAAFWDSSFSSHSLSSLLASITVGKDGNGDTAVLAVGGGLPDRFSLSLSAGSGRVAVPVRVVNRPSAFPGLGYGSNRPLVVLSADAVPATGATFEDQERWFTGNDPGLLDKVRAAGLDAIVVRRASSLVSGDLQPQLWALDFLAVTGIVSALIALSALGLYHTAIGRRRAVGDSISAYLGLSTRSTLFASALETGAMALTGLVLGVGSSWLALTLVYRHLDTQPETPPAPLLRLDVAGAALGLIAVVVLATMTAAALELRRRRSSLDSVLRNAG